MEASANRVWELMDSMRFCMLTSWNGKTQRSRPMTSRVSKEDHAIYFLDQANSEKEREIETYSAVSLAFSDTGANRYLAIAGHAQVSNDRQIIKKLWSEFDKTFFDSVDDPKIRLIKITPESAELWEGPNKVATIIKMLAAATTGYKPSMGETKRVAL